MATDSTRDPFEHRGYRAVYDGGARYWRVWRGRRFISWVPGSAARARGWIDARIAFDRALGEQR